jgi:hypothetical protein
MVGKLRLEPTLNSTFITSGKFRQYHECWFTFICCNHFLSYTATCYQTLNFDWLTFIRDPFVKLFFAVNSITPKVYYFVPRSCFFLRFDLILQCVFIINKYVCLYFIQKNQSLAENVFYANNDSATFMI